MIIDTITFGQLDRFFLNDMKLVSQALSDEEIHSIYKENKYPYSDNSQYMGIYENKELMGLLKYEYFTKIAVNVHMYISSKYQKTNIVKDAVIAVNEYFNKLDGVKKLLFMVPSSCEHVIKHLSGIHMPIEGVLTKCYWWRQKEVDLVIFGFHLETDKLVWGER